MPLYSYRCDVCGVQFDRKQGFDEPILRKCPECGEQSLRKLFTPVGIVFKGKGFYATDHRATKSLTTSKGEEKEAKPKTEGKEAEKPGKAKSEEK
jgi:putative FmdB family regulatory protein